MSRNLSLTRLIVVGVVLCALASAPASASYVCNRDLDPAPLALERYDAVFVGRVTAVRLKDPNAEPGPYPAGQPELVAEFAVHRAYKGELVGPVVVTSGHDMPAFRFEVGRIHLVWAVRGGDGTTLVTDACGRSSLEGARQFNSDVHLLDNPSQMASTPCTTLDGEGRKAVLAYIDAAYPLAARARPSESQIDWADQKLSERGESGSDCLVWIYREGLRGTGLWSHRSSPPRNGEWALSVLSRVDSAAAIPLWREREAKVQSDPWARIAVELQLLALNDREAIPAVMQFLQNPPTLPANEARFAAIARTGAHELARLDYLEATGLLRGFRGRGYVPDRILDVYIAQFARDVRSLEKLARESDTATAALNALARIDAATSIQEIVRDR